MNIKYYNNKQIKKKYIIGWEPELDLHITYLSCIQSLINLIKFQFSSIFYQLRKIFLECFHL